MELGITEDDNIVCDFFDWAQKDCPKSCGGCGEADEDVCQDEDICADGGIVDDSLCEDLVWPLESCPLTCGLCNARGKR